MSRIPDKRSAAYRAVVEKPIKIDYLGKPRNECQLTLTGNDDMVEENTRTSSN